MADGITDQELRRQLVELGAKTVGPITATTRPIYIKRLNHLRVAAKKANVSTAKQRTGRKLLGFSSDESEGESSVAEPVGRPRYSGRRTQSVSSKEKNKPDTGNSYLYLGRPALRSSKNDNSDRKNASFSIQTSFNSTGGELSRQADRGSRRSAGLGRPAAAAAAPSDPNGFDSSDSDVDHDLDDSHDLDDTDLGYSSPEKVSVSINTSPRLDDSSLFNRTLGRLSGLGTMWDGLGRRQSSGPFSAAHTDDQPNTSHSKSSRPRASFTVGEARTLNHRPATRDAPTYASSLPEATSRMAPNPVSLQHTTLTSNKTYARGQNNSYHQRTSMLNHSSGNHISQDDRLSDEENILQQGFKTKEDPGAYKISQNISMVLVLLTAFFFIALAGVYIGMDSTPVQNLSKDNWMICPRGTGSPCYPRERVEAARIVILDLAEMLSIRAGDLVCGRSNDRNMTKQEARTYLLNYPRHVNLRDDIFETALHLIHSNRHWKISLYSRAGELAATHSETQWLESDVPYYGLACHVKLIMVRVCYYALALLAVLLVVGLAWYRYRRREEETRNVYQLVERILDILKNHHDKCQANTDLQPFLAIPHVRDMLIPPKDRRRLQPRWDRAIKFLSANESRIRVETQKISGEEFAVWRWLQTSTNGKVWQGPAFGENRDVNFPNFKSPTQCLKIRNMFDPDIECEDDWHVHIEDAILEKVMYTNPSHGIVHIMVDKASREGCVYIKCSSPQEAGKAYRALHGWWFDNNLVTVKYLRLERYHERYPQAIHSNTPLSPSNNQRSSLSQPFHRSIIESC